MQRNCDMFLEELGNVTGLPLDETLSTYTVTNVGGKAVSITNFKKLLVYEPQRIIVQVKPGKLNIEGSELVVMMLDPKNLVVKGHIENIFLLKEGAEHAA